MAESGQQDEGPWTKYQPPKNPIMTPYWEQETQRRATHFLDEYPDDSIWQPGEDVGPGRVPPWDYTRQQRLGGGYHEISGDYSQQFADPIVPRPVQTESIHPADKYAGPAVQTGEPHPADKYAPQGDPIIPRRVKTESIHPADKYSDYDMEGYRQKYGEPDQSKGQHLTDVLDLPSAAGQHPADKYAQPSSDLYGRHPADNYAAASTMYGVHHPELPAEPTPETPEFLTEAASQLRRAPSELWDMTKESGQRFGERFWQGYQEDLRDPYSSAPSRYLAGLEAGFAGSPLAQQAMEAGMGTIGMMPEAGGLVEQVRRAPSRLPEGERVPAVPPGVVERPAEYEIIPPERTEVGEPPQADKPAAATGRDLAQAVNRWKDIERDPNSTRAERDAALQEVERVRDRMFEEVRQTKEAAPAAKQGIDPDKAARAAKLVERARAVLAGTEPPGEAEPRGGSIDEVVRRLAERRTQRMEEQARETEERRVKAGFPAAASEAARKQPTIMRPQTVLEAHQAGTEDGSMEAPRRTFADPEIQDTYNKSYANAYQFAQWRKPKAEGAAPPAEAAEPQERTAGPEGQRLLRSHIDQYKDELAARADEKAAGEIAEHATQPRGVREPDPHPLGAQVTRQISQTAAAAAQPGPVNRFTLRPLRSIFDRKQGRYEALQVEIKNDLQRHQQQMGTPLDVEGYRYGERDPTHMLDPEGQRWFEDNVRPVLRENQDTYRRVLKKAKDQDLPPDDKLAIMWENPAYMHRRTADSAKQMLGQMERESDPVIGRLGGVPQAASTKKRKFFALTNERTGARLPAYMDKGNVYTIGRTFPDGVLAFDKKSLPRDFKPVVGSKFQMRGQQWRIGQAYTREVEDAGGPTYLKSALTSSRLNKLELGRMEGALDAQDEIRQQLLKSNLASTSKGGGFAYKTNMPGLGNLYMPQRVAKYLDALVPKRFDDESLADYLSRAQRIQATSLFWNPLFHPGNVAAHVPMARGFRGLNPVADIRYIGRLRDAWKSVASQDARYRQWEAAGLRQMLGPRQVREQLNDLMFSRLEEMKSPQGQGLLARLGKLTNVPPASILKAWYRWSGDTMWQLGDMLNQATAEEILATGPFGGKRATPLDMAEAAEKVHRHVPAYRIPVEEMLPGKPGRMISKALQSPGMGLVNWFVRYHENIDRAFAMMGEDLLQGTRHLNGEQVADGLGAILAFGTGLAVYNYGLDPIYRQYIDEEGEAKRFGPYAPAQILVDWLSAKSVSPGRKLHLLTGGLYSPSGMTEMGANLMGLHAFSLRPLQPWAPEALVSSEKDVPWQARAKQAGISTLPPVSSLVELYRQPTISNVMQMFGAGQYQRHTEEEYKKRRAAERAGKPHRPLKRLQQEYPWGF